MMISLLTSSQRLYVHKWGGEVGVDKVSPDHDEAQEEGVSRRPAWELEVGQGGESVIVGGHNVEGGGASECQGGLGNGEHTYWSINW